MAGGRGKKRPPGGRRKKECLSPQIGALLLSLHQALRRVERCRRTLVRAGFSEKRWQEIVNDVNPELRFALRPKLLDAIVYYLETAGEPVRRELLVES